MMYSFYFILSLVKTVSSVESGDPSLTALSLCTAGLRAHPWNCTLKFCFIRYKLPPVKKSLSCRLFRTHRLLTLSGPAQWGHFLCKITRSHSTSEGVKQVGVRMANRSTAAYRDSTPFPQAMVRVARPQPTGSVSCLRQVQDAFCIFVLPPHPYFISKTAAITIWGPVHFGRNDDCQVSRQRSSPENRSGRSGFYSHILCSEEEQEVEVMFSMKPLKAFVVIPSMKRKTFLLVRNLLHRTFRQQSKGILCCNLAYRQVAMFLPE